jgi:phage baseplate assembly protein W
MATLDHLGKGIEFPFKFVPTSGSLQGVDTSAYLQQVNQSIHLILSTRIGERLMRPDFGSNLRDLVFEPLDDPTLDLLVEYTADALRKWENRIELTLVETDDSDIENSHVGIVIQYKIRGTNIVGNYVYQFESQTRPVSVD